jgi:hypothetical protein
MAEPFMTCYPKTESRFRARCVLCLLMIALAPTALGESDAAQFIERFRAAVQSPDPAALADLTHLPFLYEGRPRDRSAFIRLVVPNLFTAGVRACLARAAPQAEGDRLALWCRPYGFHLGRVNGEWRLLEFFADP